MSIRAGSVVMVGGRNVIDRLQSANLNGNVPIETVREIGNDLVVDKVPGEADFTFALESWDVTTDLMAFLHGEVGSQPAASAPGAADAAGTEYRWEDVEAVNIVSPWKDNPGTAGGDTHAGIIIPAYYPTRLSYRFGVTDNAQQTVEIAGGSFYYAQTTPVEEIAAGDGAQVAFITSESARALRLGGAGGTTFQRVFGVLVDGVMQVRGSDYDESVPGGTTAGAPAITTITFNRAPANGAQVKFVYFTETAKAVPQSANADTAIKPGAVRGRDIEVLVGTRGANQTRIHGVQSFELDATLEGEVEREMGTADATGRSVNGTDVNGTLTFRPRDRTAFFDALSLVTGVDPDEAPAHVARQHGDGLRHAVQRRGWHLRGVQGRPSLELQSTTE
jgi:hypothetical protein